MTEGVSSPLNIGERAGAVGEGFRFDAETLQHGDVEIRQRTVLVSRLELVGLFAAQPGAAGRDAFVMIEELPVLEAQVLSTYQN